MNSAKGVFASMVLLFQFLQATTGNQVVDKKVLKVDGAVSSSSRVTYFDHEKVEAAFSPDARQIPGKSANVSGGVLLDWKDGENKYLVRISRHDTPDLPMIHPFAHIFYILEGTATFVSGGTIVGSKTIESITPWAGKEIRGTAIEGGEARHLSKGDVIIVQKGVPHYWKEVQGPFIYFAVNLR